MPPVPASAPPVIRLTDRQEAFCQAMACDVGGAEAARIAGYSPNGAKQRGAFLMRQPEIRVRVQQLRANRRGDHQTLLDDAAVQVEGIITDALEKKSCGLALRAIEFRLKLRGVIQDRRIAHHYHLDRATPTPIWKTLIPTAGGVRHPPPPTRRDFPPPRLQHLPAPVVTKGPVVTRSSDLPQTAKIVTRDSDPPRRSRLPIAA